MNDSKLFVWVGFISALITIIDCIIRTMKAAKFTISFITYFGVGIFILSVFMHYILKDEFVRYSIRKFLCYYSQRRKRDSYFVENKECIYVFKNRIEMEHTKKHDIISNVNNLKQFCDKFKWSKEQKVNEIQIKSNIAGHEVTVKRIENWHQYSVGFNELGKGQRQQISITIYNLHDPCKESMLFLSSNIICRTKRLRLVVAFKDEKLKPVNIKYKIFDNYACDFPLFQENIEYNETEQKIEKVEKLPIYGYRYELTWEFEND